MDNINYRKSNHLCTMYCLKTKIRAIFTVICLLTIGSTVLGLTIQYNYVEKYLHFHDGECIINSCALTADICCTKTCNICYNVNVNITLINSDSSKSRVAYDVSDNGNICEENKIACYYDDRDIHQNLRITPFDIHEKGTDVILATLFMAFMVGISIYIYLVALVQRDPNPEYHELH